MKTKDNTEIENETIELNKFKETIVKEINENLDKLIWQKSLLDEMISEKYQKIEQVVKSFELGRCYACNGKLIQKNNKPRIHSPYTCQDCNVQIERGEEVLIYMWHVSNIIHGKNKHDIY